MEIAEETNRFSPNPPLSSPSTPTPRGALGACHPGVGAPRGCAGAGGGRWSGLGSFQRPLVSRGPFTCSRAGAAVPGAGSCQLPEVSGKLLWETKTSPFPQAWQGPLQARGCIAADTPRVPHAVHRSALGPENHSLGYPPLRPPRSPAPFLCTPGEFGLPCLTDAQLLQISFWVKAKTVESW